MLPPAAKPAIRRVGRLEEFTGSIGLAEFRLPVALTAFMAAPILHQGVRSGNIYVGSDQPGWEFTREDEETLALFAAQAAQVIANARRHREERRAITDLAAERRRANSVSFHAIIDVRPKVVAMAEAGC